MYDVYNVGRGHAGMMAAIKAGERGLKTIILEKSLSCNKAFYQWKGKM
ncbi:MAG: FAD-binding protein [Endomicrobium sp.]|nr:FAD-binding protein [Endomicrobium sp.]